MVVHLSFYREDIKRLRYTYIMYILDHIALTGCSHAAWSGHFFSMIRPQVSHFFTTHGTTYDTTTPRDAARGRKGAQPTMDDWEGGTVSNKNAYVYFSSHSMKCLCIHAYNYIHALKLFHACSTANATTQTVHEHVTCKVQYMIWFYLQLVGSRLTRLTVPLHPQSIGFPGQTPEQKAKFMNLSEAAVDHITPWKINMEPQNGG